MGKSSAERRKKAAERRAQRIREERRSKILKITAVAGTAAVVIGLVGFGVYIEINRSDGGTEPGEIEGLRTFENLTNNHVTKPVDYETTPPAGGDHHALWQNCGVYDEPLSTMNAVHSLEHGAVWITYDPDLQQEQVQKLESLYSQGSYILVSPYDEAEMPSPIVASAWGNQLELESPDDERLTSFLRTFERSGKVPEPGAACSDGLALTKAELDEIGGIEALREGM